MSAHSSAPTRKRTGTGRAHGPPRTGHRSGWLPRPDRPENSPGHSRDRAIGGVRSCEVIGQPHDLAR